LALYAKEIMTRTDRIVQRLKDEAFRHPWVPVGLPARRHFYHTADGLSICFTLDILPIDRFWHLSIARPGGRLTEEEVAFWRRAFKVEESAIENPGQIVPESSRHIYWESGV